MATTLREELLSETYRGKTPQEILATLNTPTRPTGGRQLVPIWQVEKLCYENGAYPKIASAAASHADPAVEAAAGTAMDYLSNPRFDNFDLDLPVVEQMLAALVAGGVLSSQERSAIDALGNVTTTPAMELLGRAAELHDVTCALGGS
jgi:hypothetical protein